MAETNVQPNELSEIVGQMMPKGFQFSETRENSIKLTYTYPGSRSLLLLPVALLVTWAALAVLLLTGLVRVEVFDSIMNGPQWYQWIIRLAVIGSIVGVLLTGMTLVRTIFGKTHLLFTSKTLTVEKELFGNKKSKTHEKRTVTRVRQEKRGGESSDHSPMWPLILEGCDEEITVGQQRREKSDWLGAVIANWASVPYLSFSEPDHGHEREREEPFYG